MADKILLPIVSLFAVVALVGACSTESREHFVRLVFDGVDKPPPKSRVRRDLLKEIDELKRQLAVAQETAARRRGGDDSTSEAPPIEKVKSWEKAVALLPKNPSGGVDWVKALQEEAIAPRPGIDGKAAQQAVLDLDVKLSSGGSELFAANYPHEPHTQWLSCKSCHPAIFPLGRQAERSNITMSKIAAGEYCGSCHGKVAFAVEENCARCHTDIPAASDWEPSAPPKTPIEKAKRWEDAVKLLPVTAGMHDWAKALAQGVIEPRPAIDPKAVGQPVLPLNVERVPAAGPMFKAVFPHQIHTALLSCPNCHTGIFQMAKGTTPITMAKINDGEYCGVCHGKVAFPATACGRCHPAMAGG